MIRRRLHLQIYATIIASLVLVVIVAGLVFAIFQREGFDERVFDVTAKLIWSALPGADTPRQQQAEGLRKLAQSFEFDVSLFDSNKNLIAAQGRPLPPPRGDARSSGWQRHHAVRGWGPVWLTRFPDGRWFAVDLRDGQRRRPIISLLILLVCVTGAIGLASYPFVRRLTGRIERLQQGVKRVGEGDLSARITVEGKDEVAQLATSFNQSAEQIERLVNTNRQLLANASHELRTPLARVRLGVEMLKNKPDLKRQAALENDIAELDQLIDEILLMSRLDTDATPQMNEVVDVLALAAEEANRYDQCTLDGDICEVQGNSKLLRRALRNLLENAFKHGKKPVQITIAALDDTVRILVSDSGPGIAMDEREQVFRPFYRAPGKQNVEGYGLGLALVRQIANAHGGRVDIVDDGPKASTFIIELPLSS